MNHRRGIEVQGIVQGVGFRPYVYRLALHHGLTGSIRNSEAGVLIEVQGTSAALASFLEALPREAPPLAKLHEVRDFELTPVKETNFVILQSTRGSNADTLIAPDIATCDDCIAEMRDPGNRRYGYPFINCTNCGPRFTITHGVPYDRSITSMASFTMCELCQSEYDDPLDRRFHAQPNACWHCGPQLSSTNRNGQQIAGDAVRNTIEQLLQGHIVAIKGLGGFHLAVDATQPPAVDNLRKRKHREEKPFAIMVPDIEAAKRLCHVSIEAAALLESPQRPIVLVPRRTAGLEHLAPDGNELGVFLPYTPLHHLLFTSRDLTALVMTSGNRSDEPIAIDNQEALARLGNITDFFLLHNREILLRCDDSVMRLSSGKSQFVRRSRGYVPTPIPLNAQIPSILAVGGELKNTICISRGRYAFPGQHIGDLQDLSAYEFFQESIHHFQTILEVRPEIIAHDLHPGYLSTRWAKLQTGVRLIGVQHHHAHIASCMAEHQLDRPVLGVALDGTGYGTDGAIWGGEVLIADRHSFQRAAHLAYTPMPGGEKAILEPWRMAIAYLWKAFGDDWRRRLPPSTIAAFPSKSVAFVEQLLQSAMPSTLTSSCGRLFDAVAALVCNRTTISYEAQAAIILEACCGGEIGNEEYPFSISEGAILQIDPGPLFAAIAEDLCNRVVPTTISRRFHKGLASVLAETVLRTSQQTGLDHVCLSGGTFQNSLLSNELLRHLEDAGLTVFTQSLVPPGDGGLSLGQLIVASSQ